MHIKYMHIKSPKHQQALPCTCAGEGRPSWSSNLVYAHFFQAVSVSSQKRLVISLKISFFCPSSLRAEIIPEKSSLWALEISRGSERRMKARTEVSPTYCLLEKVKPPPHTPVFPPQEHRNPILFYSPQCSILVMAGRGTLHRKGVGALLARSMTRPWSQWINPWLTLLPLATTRQKKEISLEDAA